MLQLTTHVSTCQTCETVKVCANQPSVLFEVSALKSENVKKTNERMRERQQIKDTMREQIKQHLKEQNKVISLFVKLHSVKRSGRPSTPLQLALATCFLVSFITDPCAAFLLHPFLWC